jgi:hypothetical protein
VPTANTDVIIPSSFTPVITTTSVCRHMLLYGILDIAAGASLTVNGNWTIDQQQGDLIGTGTVIFANNAGVANASITLIATLPTQKANFYNIEADRAGGNLDIPAALVNIINNFTLTAGTVNAINTLTVNGVLH